MHENLPTKRTADNAPTVGPIESGIPLPDRPVSRRYPWSLVNIGESFHVATATIKEEANRLRAAARARFKKHGEQFTVRTVDATDPQGVGVRVWRVS